MGNCRELTHAPCGNMLGVIFKTAFQRIIMTVQWGLPNPFGPTTQEIGRKFEKRVKRNLEKSGYKILKHGFHTDWIAKDKNGKTVYIECKSHWSGKLSIPQVQFLSEKQKRGYKVLIAYARKGKIKFYNFGQKAKKEKRKVRREYYPLGKPTISLKPTFRI